MVIFITSYLQLFFLMPCPNHISVGFRDCGIVGANLCDDLGERHLRRLGSDKSCEVCGIRIHGLVGDPQGHGSPKDMFFFWGGKLTIRGSHHWESLEYAKHIPLILMSLLSSIIITIHHCHYQLASHDVSLNVCDLFIYLMFTHTFA